MIVIELVYATADQQQIVKMPVANGTTARQALNSALASSLILIGDSQSNLQTVPIGVYGQLVDDHHVLADGDRLEIYRPLLQDPKERRRLQAR
jgi:putative ubiquitin-RnfH superfamily antitoxin RatB of RatAB toxin-antitoxin module